MNTLKGCDCTSLDRILFWAGIITTMSYVYIIGLRLWASL